MNDKLSPAQWESYRAMYNTSTRANTFFQMIMDEISRIGTPGGVSILDIGCGDGFHHDVDLQRRIGQQASSFVGVEPDASTPVDPIFTTVFRTDLESAGIELESIDIAYASMVLEHVVNPPAFFSKLHAVLKPGGVFWGFTVDSRHWFAAASSLFEKYSLKEKYLRLLHGRRGEDRYSNFPTSYLCNTPRQLERIGASFASVETLSLHKAGQLDFYFPSLLHPAVRLLDKVTVKADWPGSVLVVRMVK